MPYVISGDDVPELKLTDKSTIKWGITHRNGARNYSMRYIKVKKGGSTPEHSHYYEHEIYIISGEGSVYVDGIKEDFGPSDFIFIPGGKIHRIDAKKEIKMICVVPIVAARQLLGD